MTFRSTPMVAPDETGHVHGIEGGACGPLKTASEDLATHSLSIPPVAPLSADDAGITIDDDACTLLCKLMVDGGCFAMSLP